MQKLRQEARVSVLYLEDLGVGSKLRSGKVAIDKERIRSCAACLLSFELKRGCDEVWRARAGL